MPHETLDLPEIALHATLPIHDRVADWDLVSGMTKYVIAGQTIAVLDEEALAARRALVRIFWDDDRFDDLPHGDEADFIRTVGEAVLNRPAAIALRALWDHLDLADSLKQRGVQNPEVRLKEIVELTTEVGKGIPGIVDASVPILGQGTSVKVISFREALVTVDMAKVAPFIAEIFGLTAAHPRLHQALHDSTNMRSLYGSIGLTFDSTLTAMRFCALGNALEIWDEKSLPEFNTNHVLAEVLEAISAVGSDTGTMLVLA